MMPNTRPDHEFKKRLIGNDYVIIAYNESNQTFDVKTMKVSEFLRSLRMDKRCSAIDFRPVFVNMSLRSVLRWIRITLVCDSDEKHRVLVVIRSSTTSRSDRWLLCTRIDLRFSYQFNDR